MGIDPCGCRPEGRCRHAQAEKTPRGTAPSNNCRRAVRRFAPRRSGKCAQSCGVDVGCTPRESRAFNHLSPRRAFPCRVSSRSGERALRAPRKQDIDRKWI